MKRVPVQTCPDGTDRAEFSYFKNVVAKTAAYTVVYGDAGTMFTNRGAGGSVTFTLPAARKAFFIGFARVAAQNIVITPTGGAKINNGSADTALTTANNGGFIVFSDGTDWFCQTITVGAGTVTKTMLEDLARGSILVGTTANAVAAYSAKTSGQILVGDGTDLLSVAVSGDATLSSAGAVTIGAVVNGARVANVANANVIGGVPIIFRVDLPDAAGDVDVVSTHKVRIIDAKVVARGTNGSNANTVQVKNGATAITDAMSLNSKVAGDIVRAASLAFAAHEVAGSGTIRLTTAKAGGDVTATVYITAIRVA